MTRRVLAVLVLGATAFAVEVVETEHYRIHAEGERAYAEEMGRVLEKAWPQFEKYFKGKPKLKKKEKLEIHYFLTRPPWFKAVQAVGGMPPASAGGYYWPGTKSVYLYRQGTVYYTRVLWLHEAAHQFHYLARTRNKDPAAYWYTEGVAEYLSWHHWDGQTLQLGVLPHVSLKDYSAAALKEVKGSLDFAALVTGENKTPSRATAWALFRYLATGNQGKPLKKFQAFVRKMDGGNQPGPIFKKMFGQPKAAEKGFVAWLETEQQPWVYVFNEWEGAGPRALHGFAKQHSVCRLRDPATFLKATLAVEAGKTGWEGGALLHYVDNDDYSIALINWGGFMHIKRRTKSGFRTMEKGEVPGLDGTGGYKIQVFRRGNQVSMMVGTIGFGPWELPGDKLGLALNRADLYFREIEWK